jgi:hypothetical protein
MGSFIIIEVGRTVSSGSSLCTSESVTLLVDKRHAQAIEARSCFALSDSTSELISILGYIKARARL